MALQKIIADAASREALPVTRGTYILVLRMPEPATLAVGRLGIHYFAPGWYCYAGSALGSGGLRGRLRHHLTAIRRPHWHIDYLQSVAVCEEVWITSDAARLEHMWAKALLALPGARIIVPRFGASDCRCPSHLVYFAARPAFSTLRVEYEAL